MALEQLISFALDASLFALVMSIGLETGWSDLAVSFRRPAMLLRAMLAVNLIVPLAAVLLCVALPLPSWSRAGIVAMALSPFSPLAPLKMLKSGAQRSFVVGTYASLMIAAVIIIPATVAILEHLASQSISVSVPAIGAFVFETVLIPLALGIWLRSIFEKVSERAANIARTAAIAILAPIALLILVRYASAFALLIGDGTLAAIAASVGAGLFSGYALGGSNVANRNALAEAAATRHPGLAAMIVRINSSDTRALAAVLLYFFTGMVLVLLYKLLLRIAKSRSPAAANVHRS